MVVNEKLWTWLLTCFMVITASQFQSTDWPSFWKCVNFRWRGVCSYHSATTADHIGSGEGDFWISSIYIHYFGVISPCKSAWPFIWTNLDPNYLRMLCAKFGWNKPIGLRSRGFLNFSSVCSLFRTYLIKFVIVK